MAEVMESVSKSASASHIIYENATISTESIEATLSLDDRKLHDSEWRDCHDLTNLSILSEGHLLECLKERYFVDLIYTQMKSHIISINPGRPIPEMYSLEMMSKAENLGAHIFNIGQMALARLINKQSSAESIVISGESGSGKTECCRHLLRYLIHQSVRNHGVSDEKAQDVEKKLLQANPVLEAFGNAPTCHNRNSSRFGKFIELLYHPKTGVLLGGRIQIYLLEKTRILHLRSSKPHPFHVFHAMSTMSPEDRSRFYLDTEDSWCRMTPYVTWDSLTKSMITLGIENEDRQRITTVLSALVLLSRLNFGTNNSENHVTIGSENHARLSRISELLGARQKLLNASLTENKFSSRRESVYIRSCTLEEANSRVDTLMKLMYQLLFEFVIKQANMNIHSNSDVIEDAETLSLGLLDLYGFECFEVNSLEQLCINYANEKLQRYFVESILMATKLEYEQEGVHFPCGDMNSDSKVEVAMVLEKHLFSLLEEECRMQRRGMTATRLATRLRSELQPKFPDVVIKVTPNDGPSVDMQIRHYAGVVDYDLSNFLEKNADKVPADLFNLMKESHLGQWLLRDQSTCSLSTFVNGHKRRPAVCTQFRDAVANLVRRLDDSSEVYFIRCVKPFAEAGLTLNSGLERRFDFDYVRQQLHSSGVMDTIRVCRAAIHPVRIKYEDFHQRYRCLFNTLVKQHGTISTSNALDSPSVYVDLEKRFREQHRLPTTPPRSSTRSVRRRTGASEMDQQRRVCIAISHVCLPSSSSIHVDQFGRQLLFLTQEQSDRLEATRLALHHHAACILQSSVRSWLAKLRFHRLRYAVVKIQRFIRRWLISRRRVEDIRNRAASKIQHCVRHWLSLKRLESKRINDDTRDASLTGVFIHEKLRQDVRTILSPVSENIEDQNKANAVETFRSQEKVDNESGITEASPNCVFFLPDEHLEPTQRSRYCDFYRDHGILSCRYISKSGTMHLSDERSRCHRLLPYSNLRPLYRGCPVLASYRLSITNCL